MTRQRTSAEIEAGARAIYQNRSQTRWAWEELEPKQREHFLAVAQDTLAAADAAAAPAVGVSNRVTANELVVAYGKAAIAWSKDTSNQSLGDAMDAAKHRVIDALLTAQPEPGTEGEQG